MTDLQESTSTRAAAADVKAFDNPEAYIPSDRRRALAAGVEMLDRVEGAAVFADISGFTPLTEALANQLGPQRGAEELTANLNRVFHAIIAELDRYGGDVIYFSGDAITCWIDGDDGARATACGLAMQKAMARVGKIVTPAGSTVRLAMKVAVAVGKARRFLVGDPDIQLIDVLAGRLIDELAAAEHQAEKGDVVLEQSALESLGDRVTIREERVDEESGRTCGVVGRLRVEVGEAPAPPLEEPLDDYVVAEWLLPAVYERIRAGRGEFLAELRPAFPVFVRFAGIDYDDDDDAIGKLDVFVCRAQQIFDSYGGNLLQLTLGDKGAYLYAVFGSPLAHEDDAARAAAAALELQELEATTAATEIQIGITHGRLRSGTYGHEMRRTFVCLGDAVNLSARLMSKAPPGQIYVSDAVRRGAGDGFTWERLPDMTVKGKAEPVAVHALTGVGRKSLLRHTRHQLPIFGRREELDRLAAHLDDAVTGKGSVVGISAEAGMGKSRLVAEFVRGARRRGEVVAFGECQAYGSNTSYFAWREVWRTLFHLHDDDPEDAQLAHLEEALTAIDPALVPRVPLLGSVVGLAIPDNDLTRTFDAKLRKGSLEDLLVECLRARAAHHPLVLVVEDCHWLDELSRDLLVALARSVPHQSVLIVLAYRPQSGVGDALGIETLPHFGEIQLGELDLHESSLLIRSKLEQLLEADSEPPEALIELVTRRSQGNPFYIEELLVYINGQGIDLQDEAALKKLELPESLHSLILSRIDKLSEQPRRTLKVASVLGRVFRAPMLPGVYPELGLYDEIRSHLQAMSGLDLVGIDREADESYLFKHVVTQEVAYESMPFAIRSMLHERTGDYIEESEPDAIDRNLDLLAHHYWHSENLPKKREYLMRAGRGAQANYANAAAIDYYERATPLLEGTALAEVSEALGDARERLGLYDKADAAYRQARRWRADDPVAQAELLLKGGRIQERQGRYSEALRWFRRGLTRLDGVEEPGAAAVRARLQVAYGVSRQLQGRSAETIRWCRLAIDEATRAGARAALAHAYYILDWGLVDHGTPQEAVFSPLAIEIYEALGDLGNQAMVRNNMGGFAYFEGRWDEAVSLYELAREGFATIGDPVRGSHTTFNIGEILCDQGRLEEAGELLRDALAVWSAAGWRDQIALANRQLGTLALRAGRAEVALSLYEAARAEFAAVGAKSEVTETDIRMVECLLHTGDDARALSLAADTATRAKPIHLPMLWRVTAFAQLHAGEAARAEAALWKSLAAARERRADYQLALTLDTLARVTPGRDDGRAELEAERDSILAGLGVVALPPAPPGIASRVG